MADKKSTKRSTRKPAAKKPAPEVKPQVPGKEIWRCIVDWVRYHGAAYERGNTILVMPGMTDAEKSVLGKYFEPTKTGIMTGVSEPVELLDEGEDHASHSN